MANIPGYCRHRGAVFDGRGGIRVQNVGPLHLSGGRITCPNCGKDATFIEGTFTEQGRGLEFISGPPLSKAILEALREVAGERSRRKSLRKMQ